jgi:hypothetical protein
MAQVYDWYEIVDTDANLSQGDFINECPIIVPTPNKLGEVQDAEVKNYNVIVISQSCDLEFKKVDLVLVCPYWELSQFEKMNNFYKSTEGKESLRRGYLPGYHLLNEIAIEGYEMGYLVVDFRNVYGVPFDFLRDLAKRKGKRIRLLPPYREHLSQSFARFFMRVGLPVDIPKFSKSFSLPDNTTV